MMIWIVLRTVKTRCVGLRSILQALIAVRIRLKIDLYYDKMCAAIIVHVSYSVLIFCLHFVAEQFST